jgi:hypothetical protein
VRRLQEVPHGGRGRERVPSRGARPVTRLGSTVSSISNANRGVSLGIAFLLTGRAPSG